MDHPEQNPKQKPKQQMVITILVAAFALVFFILVLNGGMCERYQGELDKQDHMRKYIDSMRTEEQKKIPTP